MLHSRKIALFGGTFDPVHSGHLEAAKKAVEALQLDQVIFIPCRRSPHKIAGPSATDQDRLEMLKIATAEYPWAEVNDYEIKKAPPSYTWETVRHFKTRLDQNTQFSLIIGLDQWEKLPLWKNIKNLAQEVRFIVVGRTNHQLIPHQGFHVQFIDGKHPASASEIRSQIEKQEATPWLNEKVLHYIAKKSLYH